MIFGLEQAKIIIDENEEIILEHSNLEPEFLKPILLEYPSPLNGHRNFIYLGDYAGFKVELDLTKYDNKDLFFSKLKNLENELVVFHPHKDGDAIKDIAGNDVLFFLTVEPYYLNNEVEQDMILLTFHSVGFVDYRGIWNIQGYGYQFAYNFGYGV